VIEIRNNGDSAYAVPRQTPGCGVNPRLFVESVATNESVPKLREGDALYAIIDRAFVDLVAGGSYVDTVDIAYWIDYEFSKGNLYRLWIIYESLYGYVFDDSLRTAPVWIGTLVSDTLEFEY
jgi:hypothetical protein